MQNRSNTFTRISYYVLGLGFIFVGVLHFVRPSGFVAIVPPFLPAHLELVYISGVFEILGGIGLFFPRYRRITIFCLIALVLAVFPANIYMVMHPEIFATGWITPLALWIRLPLQPILIWWLWSIRPREIKT
jgi:uncharacterized membrane protein